MTASYDIGLIGLGVMGRNFLLNLADHGYNAAGYDRDPKQIQALRDAGHPKTAGLDSLDELIAGLKKPRAVLLLVPAGNPVDAVLDELKPRLESGDLIIDGGNSHFIETDRRTLRLAEHEIAFLGMGVSGGEEGARHGPSLMPGGAEFAYEHVRPMLEAAAAKVDGVPCTAYLGPGSAGHYVKMVHNGIEYAFMQLIAECYDLLKRGAGFTPGELHDVFARWNETELDSYLIEITAAIFTQQDEQSGGMLIDVIRGEANQKGTGMWASQNAMSLGVPTPNIDTAVMARNLSDYAGQRRQAADLYKNFHPAAVEDSQELVKNLQQALYVGLIVSFAQGMSLLAAASKEYAYNLNLETVARIWRGGCIIRAALLERIRAAYLAQPELPNLLLDPELSQAVSERETSLRAVVRTAADIGLPAPGFSAALAYLDAFRSAWLPANLIQAQRDFFGAHRYERLDIQGMFHTRWNLLAPSSKVDHREANP